MTVELIPENEEARLAAVRRYDILDTPPDGAFERITALAARLFDVPIAIVSIVDTDRIWFKSHHGLEVEEIDREPGLCASAILHDGPWLVSDASKDPRTLANPLVAGEFGLRFYAGVPLTTSDGYNLGTLCVIDQQPREVGPEETENLTDLAALVMDELELRRSALSTLSLEAELRRRAEDTARTLQEALLPPELPAVPGIEMAARYHVADRAEVGGDFYDAVALAERCAAIVGDSCGKGTKAAALTGTARWALRTVMIDDWTPADAIGRLNEVLVNASPNPERYVTLAVASLRPRLGGGVDITVALGGHPRPLIVRTDGRVESVGDTAPVVGWLAEAAFIDAEATLAAGDVLVMFTDGLLEAVTPGVSGTDDTALRALLVPVVGRSADEVAAHLDSFLPADDLADDAAFLVIRAE
ncbi:MAG TPA: GAF domain-containing SpoIIE family protein phosphatase [Acidimicrobiales bacterium]|nr:GAF domain-containing SpoIIE family protein phosphatase [Acidimicrobiales bacterium]